MVNTKKISGPIVGLLVPAFWAFAISSSVFAEDLPQWIADLRDPTKPINFSNAVAAEEMPVQLNAIFVRGGKYTAVINGQSVSVNDSVDDIVVTEISRHAIKYRRKGQIYELALRQKLRLN